MQTSNETDSAPKEYNPNHDPAQEPIFKFFKFDHLPQHLQPTSAMFFDVACKMIATLPRNAERSAGLRKLMEAKDCAVRAMIP